MRFLSSLALLAMLGTCHLPSLLAQGRDPKDLQPNTAPLGVINDVDVTVTDMTEEKLSNPPKREIRIERLDEPLKSKLPKADPKLFEQKFAATLRVRIRNRVANVPLDERGRLPLLANLGSVNGTGSNYVSSSSVSAAEFFTKVIAAVPTAGLPAKEEREFFSDPQVYGEMLLLTVLADQGLTSSGGHWQFTIFGTTPQLVEKRATALLEILDRGGSQPVQLAIFKQREPLCTQLRNHRKTVEDANRAVNSLQEQSKGYADFTPDMLSNLRVQQLQLEVDLAGVKARIAACDRVLAGSALKPERRSQLEDLKVAAEIELAGYEARLMKSLEFIAKVKAKMELLGKVSTLESVQSLSGDKIRQLESHIRSIDVVIRSYGPLPLVDNKITVQPLEWEK
jgi:hypothetical protein